VTLGSPRESPEIRLAVFDVDGTMYDQSSLRARMLVELLLYLLRHPLRLRELAVVREYRRVHENFGPGMVEDLEGALVREVGRNLSEDPEGVRLIVDEWLFRRPMKYLRNRCLPEVKETIFELRRRGIAVAVLSDHYPVSKLEAMGLHFEDAYYATRADLNCLKPNPRLLLKILSDHEVDPAECVVIGDRDDRDGALARAVGARFILFPDRRLGRTLLDGIDAHPSMGTTQ